MVTALLLPIRWGLYGKEPGQIADYCLLERSGDADLTGPVERFIAGTPTPGSPGDPAALPWVTVGGFVAGGFRRVGIALMEWPAERRLDHYHRSTTLTRYYDFHLNNAEDAHAGFATLHDAVVDLPLPGVDELTAPVVPTDVSALAEWIDEYGFAKALGIAASMLDGPVVMFGDHPVEVGERLRLLDMFAALLPYGLRADLVVGTWVPPEGRRKIRLGFGRGTGAGAGEVRYGEPVDLTTASESARRYFARVSELHRRWGTLRVVQGLWQEVEPLGFADPGAVLVTLSKLDLPYAVAADIGRGTFDLDEVRLVVTSCPLLDYEDDVRDRLLTTLIRRGSNDDLGLLRPYWSPGVRGWLVDEAVRAGIDGGRASTCAAAAYANGDLEQFLADLCRRAVLSTDDRVRVAAVETLTDRDPFAAGAGTQVWQSMLQQPELCLRLLDRAIARCPSTVDGWLRWLTAPGDQCPAWMLGLAVAAGQGNPSQLDAGDLEAIGGRGPLTALRLAVRSHTVPDVLTQLWRSLVSTSDPVLVEEIRQVLPAVPTLPVPLRPRYDVLLVRHGVARRMTPATLSDSDRALYLDKLILCLREFTAGGDTVVDQLVDVELRSAAGAPGALPQSARYLVELADRLDRKRRSRLLRRIAEAAVDSPEAIAGLPKSVRDEMFKLSEALRQRRALDNVARVAGTTGTGAAALADVWLDAEQEGVDRARIAKAAARWPGASDPAHLLWLIDAIEAAGTRRVSLERGIDLFVGNVECIAGGHLGATAVPELRKLLNTRIAIERRRWERVEKAIKPRRSGVFGRGKEEPS